MHCFCRRTLVTPGSVLRVRERGGVRGGQPDTGGVRDQCVRRQPTVPHHLRQRTLFRRHPRRPAPAHRLLQREADPGKLGNAMS